MNLRIDTTPSSDIFSPLQSPGFEFFSTSGIPNVMGPGFFPNMTSPINIAGMGSSPFPFGSLSQFFSPGGGGGVEEPTMSSHDSCCTDSNSSEISTPEEDDDRSVSGYSVVEESSQHHNQVNSMMQQQQQQQATVQPSFGQEFHQFGEPFPPHQDRMEMEVELTPPHQDITFCENCGTFETCMWRRGGYQGNQILCNRCGLYYNRKGQHRPDLKRKPSVRRRRPNNRQCSNQPGEILGAQRGVSKNRLSSSSPSNNGKQSIRPEFRGPIQLALSPDQINALLKVLSPSDGIININNNTPEFSLESGTATHPEQIEALSGILGYLTNALRH